MEKVENLMEVLLLTITLQIPDFMEGMGWVCLRTVAKCVQKKGCYDPCTMVGDTFIGYIYWRKKVRFLNIDGQQGNHVKFKSPEF